MSKITEEQIPLKTTGSLLTATEFEVVRESINEAYDVGHKNLLFSSLIPVDGEQTVVEYNYTEDLQDASLEEGMIAQMVFVNIPTFIKYYITPSLSSSSFTITFETAPEAATLFPTIYLIGISYPS